MQCGSGRTGCFSFHPRKVVTTGEGGMVTTNDRTLADHMRRLRSHGGVRSTPAMRFEEIGFNFRLSEIPAALGLAQLSRLDEILSHRREVSHAYELLLREVDGVSLREEPLGQAWSYQSFVVMLDPTLDRDRVIRDMMCRGIETTLGTYAMHAQPAFAPYGYQPGDLPNSFQAQESSLTLPLSPSTTTHEVEQVCDALALAISSQ